MKKTKIIIILIVVLVIVLSIALLFGRKTFVNFGGLTEQSTAARLFDESGKDENKIHIGDYVAYNEGEGNTYTNNRQQALKTDGTSKWRVLGVEDGKIKLIADDSFQYSVGIKFYENFDEVNKLCEIFGKGEGAESARCIQFSDIQQFADFSRTTLEKDNKYLVPYYYMDDNSIEYNMLFKNEDGFYKKYVINDKNYNCFGIEEPEISLGKSGSYIGEYFLPVVILKQDINITGKDENGVWQIDNSEKKYKDMEYIQIATAEDFIKLTKEGADLKANYKLTADIDLSEVKGLTPIGNGENPFKGVFDGDNHTITGISIDNYNMVSYMACEGVFAITENAIIKNLNIKDSRINWNSGSESFAGYVGVLAGRMEKTKIINCNVSGVINGQSQTGGVGYGLLAGDIYNTQVYNCNVSGNIQVDKCVCAGGLFGGELVPGEVLIEKCNANANINVKEGFNVAGFIGKIEGRTMDIVKCSATGNIQFDGDPTLGCSGFINNINRDEAYMEIYLIQCCSKVNVTCTSKEDKWGIVAGFVNRSENTHFFDCYYTGNLSMDPIAGWVGSFCRHDDSSNCINNCYTDANLQGKSSDNFNEIDGTFYYNKEKTNEFKSENENCVGLTSEEFEKKESFKGFDFDNVWKWDEKSKRPILKWE